MHIHTISPEAPHQATTTTVRDSVACSWLALPWVAHTLEHRRLRRPASGIRGGCLDALVDIQVASNPGLPRSHENKKEKKALLFFIISTSAWKALVRG